MLKLISLNMEGARHYERIVPFIQTEQPDCLCLQEMPESFQSTLLDLGYNVSYAPMVTGCALAPGETIGVAIASHDIIHTQYHLYFGPKEPLPYDRAKRHETVAHQFVHCTVLNEAGEAYEVVTTHLPVTDDGAADEEQRQAVRSLLAKLEAIPSHILCGDMNMPRGYNDNYAHFQERYTDTVPVTYKSSLDRSLHRMGNSPELRQPIFDAYMVDYVFIKSPYQASNVRLQFGLSDHAAVLATLERQTENSPR